MSQAAVAIAMLCGEIIFPPVAPAVLAAASQSACELGESCYRQLPVHAKLMGNVGLQLTEENVGRCVASCHECADRADKGSE